MNHQLFILESIRNFLKLNKNGLILCEGVDDGFYGTLTNISRDFADQCIELPCSENASVGMALGAAPYGILPIVCFQRVEFALLALEQLFNNGSKVSFLTAGKRKTPSLFRLVIGRGWGQGPSHSQSLEGVFAQLPKTEVFLPVFPEDTKYIVDTFSESDGPTITLEHRWIHYSTFSNVEVKSSSPYVVREGTDITLLANSYNVLLCLRLADILNEFGINVEVINAFCINSTDFEPIISSVSKTRRIVTVDLGSSLINYGKSAIAECAMRGISFKSRPAAMGVKADFAFSSSIYARNYFLFIEDIALVVLSTLSVSEETKAKVLKAIEDANSPEHLDKPSKLFNGPF